VVRLIIGRKVNEFLNKSKLQLAAWKTAKISNRVAEIQSHSELKRG